MKSSFTLVANDYARGAAILFSYLQLALFLIFAACLGSARIGLQLRNARSWDAIVKRLLVRLDLDPKSADTAAKMDERFTNDAIEQRAGTVGGRRMLFHAAGAMMEMADYAERNGGGAARPAAENLRDHAMAIRTMTVKDFVRPSTRRREK